MTKRTPILAAALSSAILLVALCCLIYIPSLAQAAGPTEVESTGGGTRETPKVPTTGGAAKVTLPDNYITKLLQAVFGAAELAKIIDGKSGAEMTAAVVQGLEIKMDSKPEPADITFLLKEMKNSFSGYCIMPSKFDELIKNVRKMNADIATSLTTAFAKDVDNAAGTRALFAMFDLCALTETARILQKTSAINAKIASDGGDKAVAKMAKSNAATIGALRAITPFIGKGGVKSEDIVARAVALKMLQTLENVFTDPSSLTDQTWNNILKKFDDNERTQYLKKVEIAEAARKKMSLDPEGIIYLVEFDVSHLTQPKLKDIHDEIEGITKDKKEETKYILFRNGIWLKNSATGVLPAYAVTPMTEDKVQKILTALNDYQIGIHNINVDLLFGNISYPELLRNIMDSSSAETKGYNHCYTFAMFFRELQYVMDLAVETYQDKNIKFAAEEILEGFEFPDCNELSVLEMISVYDILYYDDGSPLKLIKADTAKKQFAWIVYEGMRVTDPIKAVVKKPIEYDTLHATLAATWLGLFKDTSALTDKHFTGLYTARTKIDLVGMDILSQLYYKIRSYKTARTSELEGHAPFLASIKTVSIPDVTILTNGSVKKQTIDLLRKIIDLIETLQNKDELKVVKDNLTGKLTSLVNADIPATEFVKNAAKGSTASIEATVSFKCLTDPFLDTTFDVETINNFATKLLESSWTEALMQRMEFNMPAMLRFASSVFPMCAKIDADNTRLQNCKKFTSEIVKMLRQYKSADACYSDIPVKELLRLLDEAKVNLEKATNLNLDRKKHYTALVHYIKCALYGFGSGDRSVGMHAARILDMYAARYMVTPLIQSTESLGSILEVALDLFNKEFMVLPHDAWKSILPLWEYHAHLLDLCQLSRVPARAKSELPAIIDQFFATLVKGGDKTRIVNAYYLGILLTLNGSSLIQAGFVPEGKAADIYNTVTNIIYPSAYAVYEAQAQEKNTIDAHDQKTDVLSMTEITTGMYSVTGAKFDQIDNTSIPEKPKKRLLQLVGKHRTTDTQCKKYNSRIKKYATLSESSNESTYGKGGDAVIPDSAFGYNSPSTLLAVIITAFVVFAFPTQ